MSAITPEWKIDFGKTSFINQSYILKHFALEVWVSIYTSNRRAIIVKL